MLGLADFHFADVVTYWAPHGAFAAGCFHPSRAESRGRSFQFAFDGVLLPFAPARPALPVLFRFAKRHGARTPEESLKLKADHVTKPF